MTELNNPEYYDRRERQEQELAERSHDAVIGDIHRDLALRYAGLAREARETIAAPRRLGLNFRTV